ncbi:biotin-dependent carboxyltransferase family protein [Lentibacillus salicampi]|uniref:Biotin-dependent carboxyltransferase n=1 Tax=Lentibacillus salicampi TaxID=175306 RepID=A0A4Y9AEP8_9BACI|nr:biotin-dependent carboxyltransferase family protein [Lentibacillus salicampi]TFJ94303.1 biotin-dependent carboxyltransferase [Lentibacillus salicampi]
MQQQTIFHVHKPGVMTTFQDLGRTGYQQYGVPVSGAMDQFSLQMANILVGNPRNTVGLEVTLIGPELEAVSTIPITAAITGAALEPKVNGTPAPMWQSFQLKQGDRLTFGKHEAGVRAYIAVAGGFDAPTFFGSQSTDIKSGFGGPLEKHQTIQGVPLQTKPGRGLLQTERPVYPSVLNVSIVEGPHMDYFNRQELDRFYSQSHVVDTSSNRMGYRLKSKSIRHQHTADIWSDAVPFGGIQIPGNGQPIILMADRQTTGGYPRIGTIISADLPKLAQLVPKGKIRFHPVSVEAAQQRAVQLEIFLYKMATFTKHS